MSLRINNSCKKDFFKEASSRNIVTAKVTLFVNFSTGLYLKEEEKEEEEGVTVIRLIQPRLEIHPSGNVQGMCIFNNGSA